MILFFKLMNASVNVATAKMEIVNTAMNANVNLKNIGKKWIIQWMSGKQSQNQLNLQI